MFCRQFGLAMMSLGEPSARWIAEVRRPTTLLSALPLCTAPRWRGA
jgi:hypothetical protein